MLPIKRVFQYNIPQPKYPTVLAISNFHATINLKVMHLRWLQSKTKQKKVSFTIFQQAMTVSNNCYITGP